MSTDKIVRAAELISSAKKVVVLTGAGISKESGIPTFRDAQTGLWANYDPQTLATPQGFMANPSLVWQWYEWRRKMLATVKPNPGHFAIAKLESMVPQLALLTQNVDGLHRTAGSKEIIELHGSITKHKCFDHGHPFELTVDDLNEPPRCYCGSLVRPAVVWFGEVLDEADLRLSFMHSESADLFLVVGTSALVQPAASFPFAARRRGAKIVECNVEETPVSEIADVNLTGPAGEMLPQVIDALNKCKMKS